MEVGSPRPAVYAVISAAAGYLLCDLGDAGVHGGGCRVPDVRSVGPDERWVTTGRRTESDRQSSPAASETSLC